MEYIPADCVCLEEPVYVIIDTLIKALQKSNGLDFCTEVQLKALDALLHPVTL